MPRPLKHDIDYFPHDVEQGKTLFIIEDKYGNDGYAFWFKLLSILCKQQGLVYDYNNPIHQEFLCAITHFKPDIAYNILSTLADLDAIDKDLWVEKKLIWANNLAERLSPLWSRRRSIMPSKPSINGQKPTSSELLHTQTPQSKVKYSKDKVKKEQQNIYQFYENNFELLKPHNSEILKDLEDTYTHDKVLEALKIAVKSGSRNLRYVEGVLKKNEVNNEKPPAARRKHAIKRVTESTLRAAELAKRKNK